MTTTRERQAAEDLEPCPVCAGRGARRRRVARAEDVVSCAACGSWYRVPRPTAAELARLYTREYYNAWGLHVDESAVRATKRATLAAVLRVVEAHRVRDGNAAPRLLDVGAATGTLLELAAERGWEPFAVELNAYAAEVLRQRFGRERVFEGELTECAFPEASFDAVTMTDLIEHVLDVPGSLAAAGRLLRPGGVLCLTTPRVDSWSRRLMGSNWLHFKLEHVQYFSRAGLLGALRRSGLTPVAACTYSKRLTLDYLHNQLRTYPHWLLTPLVAAVCRVAPARLRRHAVPLCCGEMLVCAVRSGSAPSAGVAASRDGAGAAYAATPARETPP